MKTSGGRLPGLEKSFEIVLPGANAETKQIPNFRFVEGRISGTCGREWVGFGRDRFDRDGLRDQAQTQGLVADCGGEFVPGDDAVVGVVVDALAAGGRGGTRQAL